MLILVQPRVLKTPLSVSEFKTPRSCSTSAFTRRPIWFKSPSLSRRSSPHQNRRYRAIMVGAQALKRIPRIKFPNRNPNPSGSTSQTPSINGMDDQIFLASLNENAPKTIGGKASLQPKRTPISNEEIEAILLGGCI